MNLFNKNHLCLNPCTLTLIADGVSNHHNLQNFSLKIASLHESFSLLYPPGFDELISVISVYWILWLFLASEQHRSTIPLHASPIESCFKSHLFK